MRLLSALQFVDYVVSFEEDTPLDLIKSINPDVLTKGADWPKEKIVGYDHLLQTGGKVETIALVDGLSTTNIVEKIRRRA